MKTLETQVTVLETNYYKHEMHSTRQNKEQAQNRDTIKETSISSII